MKLQNAIFFSGALRRSMRLLSSIFLIFRRTLIILFFRWPKSLKIESIAVHDKFLLTNGILLIRWQIRNCVWVSINKHIKSYHKNGVALQFDKIDKPILIEVRGLFGTHRHLLTVESGGRLDTNSFTPPPVNKQSIVIEGVHKSISEISSIGFDSVLQARLTHTLHFPQASIEIHIPPSEKIN